MRRKVTIVISCILLAGCTVGKEPYTPHANAAYEAQWHKDNPHPSLQSPPDWGRMEF